jgi:threonine synthase
VIVARDEGNTPLYFVGASAPGGWGAIGRFAGVERLRLKHEGHNPTGSFKDRGMTVGMTVARAAGARAVACASTGNTSASLAAYAAQAGLPALVFLPAGKVAGGKLAQSIAYGARRIEVAGDFDQAMRQVERAAADLGIYLLNSINPFRIAGQRAIGYEILQQLQWQAPDWIVLPAGNLGNTSAIGAALLHARSLGLIERLPRLAAVQAAGADPFYRSFLSGWHEFAPVQAHTRATAINIGAPVSYARARAVIEGTSGVVTEVTDEEIFAAKARVDRAGIGCEPASAASVAGVRRLVREGVIAADASVVAILTGNLLKDTEQVTGENLVPGTGDAAADELAEQVRAYLRR